MSGGAWKAVVGVGIFVGRGVKVRLEMGWMLRVRVCGVEFFILLFVVVGGGGCEDEARDEVAVEEVEGWEQFVGEEDVEGQEGFLEWWFGGGEGACWFVFGWRCCWFGCE